MTLFDFWEKLFYMGVSDMSLNEGSICNIMAEGFRFIYIAFGFS